MNDDPNADPLRSLGCVAGADWILSRVVRGSSELLREGVEAEVGMRLVMNVTTLLVISVQKLRMPENAVDPVFDRPEIELIDSALVEDPVFA